MALGEETADETIVKDLQVVPEAQDFQGRHENQVRQESRVLQDVPAIRVLQEAPLVRETSAPDTLDTAVAQVTPLRV